MYIAQIYHRGKLTWQGMPFADRKEAAGYAFRNGPQKTKVCSTSGAYRDPTGNWRANGMDICWHQRHDFLHDKPQQPCDHGLFGDDNLQMELT